MQKKDLVVEDYSSNFPLSNIQHHQNQFSGKRGSAPSAPPYHQHHSHQQSTSSAVAEIEDDFKNQTAPGTIHDNDPNY